VSFFRYIAPTTAPDTVRQRIRQPFIGRYQRRIGYNRQRHIHRIVDRAPGSAAIAKASFSKAGSRRRNSPVFQPLN